MSFWVTRSSLVLVLMGGPVIPVLVGCSGPATPDSGEARAGTLRVGLGAALDGVQYWLEASFAVTGPESTVLASAPGDTVLRAELSPGRYVAELQPGYQVLQESNGTLVPVHSELRSEAAQSFTITADQATRVSYRFAVDGRIIDFGRGELDVDFEVVPRAALVRFVSPYVGVSGRAGRLVARGIDFDSAGATPAVLVGDAEITGVALTGSTELSFEYPPLPAGRYVVRVRGAVPDSEPAELVVVDPLESGSDVISAPGPRSRVIYDAERRSLYAVNRVSQELERYRFESNAWNVLDSVSLPLLTDAALTPDGRSLIVLGANGVSEIKLDEEPPMPVLRHVGMAPFCGGYLDTLAMGNDGGAFVVSRLSQCSGSTTSFRFDVRDYSLVPNGYPDGYFYNGRAAVSGDGTRIYVGESGLSPEQSLQIFETTGWTSTPGPAAYDLKSISVSDDASRVILENRDVRDRELLLTGFLPEGGVALASHDSSRAFVYREDGSPHIVVYDLLGDLESAAMYPAVASIELPVSPTGDTGRLGAVTLAATPDDRVLFVSGDSSIVVLPLE